MLSPALRLLLPALLLVPACVSVDSPPFSDSPAVPTSISLNEADAAAIGKKIWQNECAGTVEGLTTWNAGEDFPSLGIGHFIWYVPGRPGPFQESFPPLLDYMRKRGVTIPAWLNQAQGSPWKSRAEFLAAQQSPQMKELRQFLAGTVSVQTGFIVQRLEQSLPKMQAATPAQADKEKLRTHFYLLAGSRNGLYALIDYVNFKGEGVKAEEKYQGVGWGLRDVLLEMPSGTTAADATAAFSEAAKRVMQRRVKNSPPARNEAKWLPGWLNRCETYKRGI